MKKHQPSDNSTPRKLSQIPTMPFLPSAVPMLWDAKAARETKESSSKARWGDMSLHRFCFLPAGLCLRQVQAGG